MGRVKFEILSLKKSLKRAIIELSMEEATDVQARVLPRLLESPTDLVVQAPTGSGKSASFILPILQRFDLHAKTIQALILVPTRELAIQVTSQIEELAKFEKVKIATIYGGTPLISQIKMLTKKWPQIVVGTPGRVRDLVNRQKLCLDKIQTIVLDEADEMVSLGFIEDMVVILKACSLQEKKIWMFSATIPSIIKDKINIFLKNPFRVKAQGVEQKISYQNIEVPREDWFRVLEQLIIDDGGKSSIVFCNSRSEVVKISNQLQINGLDVLPLHGGMEQIDREKNLNQFRKEHVQILVCTDLAARGLDILTLDCIYNLGLPKDPTLMVHRIGRVGRKGREGKVVNLIER